MFSIHNHKILIDKSTALTCLVKLPVETAEIFRWASLAISVAVMLPEISTGIFDGCADTSDLGVGSTSQEGYYTISIYDT